jgi:hypothetical protein
VFYKRAILGSKCGGWSFGEAQALLTGFEQVLPSPKPSKVGWPAGEWSYGGGFPGEYSHPSMLSNE